MVSFRVAAQYYFIPTGFIMSTRRNSSAARLHGAVGTPIEDVEMTNSVDDAESDAESELLHDDGDTGMYEIIKQVTVFLCSVMEE